MADMTRQDACRELELISKVYPDTPEECARVGQALVIAQKAIKDKKARYWKRRYLKQRELVYKAIELFENCGKPASAKILRIVVLGGAEDVDSDSETPSANN